jgi:hypothetical protein
MNAGLEPFTNGIAPKPFAFALGTLFDAYIGALPKTDEGNEEFTIRLEQMVNQLNVSVRKRYNQVDKKLN